MESPCLGSAWETFSLEPNGQIWNTYQSGVASEVDLHRTDAEEQSVALLEEDVPVAWQEDKAFRKGPISERRKRGCSSVFLSDPAGTGGAVSGGAETTTCRIAFAIAANYNGVYEERTFNKPSIRITATHHFVVIDIENQRASVQDANGNIYSFIDMPIPDPVGPGKVNVRITTLSKTNALSIIPRWRCL